jgi:hypothetical protein
MSLKKPQFLLLLAVLFLLGYARADSGLTLVAGSSLMTYPDVSIDNRCEQVLSIRDRRIFAILCNVRGSAVRCGGQKHVSSDPGMFIPPSSCTPLLPISMLLFCCSPGSSAVAPSEILREGNIQNAP